MASTMLSAKAIGSTVKLNIEGIEQEFIIVHHGKPSAMYDDSFNNGTWLLLKKAYKGGHWHSLWENDYAASRIHNEVNKQFLNKLDTDIQSIIKQVKIPYRPGKGVSESISSGALGLSCKIFLLSAYEVGGRTSDYAFIPQDGAKLSYFDVGIGTTANNKRISYLGDSPQYWWLRSPQISNPNDSSSACLIHSDGTFSRCSTPYTWSTRPAFVMPSTLWVIKDGKVITSRPPTAPKEITIPSLVMGGENLTINWGASTVSGNTLSGYILERQLNGGVWTQIYKGLNRSYNDTITFGWTSIAYRVEAYDSIGAESSYSTTPTKNIINNTAPTISGTNQNLGLKEGAFNISYIVTDVDNGQVITVIEKIDAKQKRSYTVASGSNCSFNITMTEWIELLNGNHTLTITASDNYNYSATRTYTFTKNETEIEFKLKMPLAADAMLTKAIMSVTREIPGGVTFTVEVCNNANDASPTWEDVTSAVISGSKFFLSNLTKTATDWGFNFRIKVERGSAVGDCFIQGVGGNFE